MPYKQVILVRQDLRLPKGKLAVQVAHASVEAAAKSGKEILQQWKESGAKKIVLKVRDETELADYHKAAMRSRLVTAMIQDAGLTVVPAGTVTCLAIGPAASNAIDKITGKLKML